RLRGLYSNGLDPDNPFLYEPVEYHSRYGAISREMTKLEGCRWLTSPSRQFKIISDAHLLGFPLNEWLTPEGAWHAWSVLVVTDLDYSGDLAAGNQFTDSWQSTDCLLYRSLSED